MNSYTAYTTEIDNLEVGVKNLINEVKENLHLKKNSVGIMFCDYGIDYDELAGVIDEEIDFPVIGASTLGLFTTSTNYSEMSMSLLVLTADDCEFSVGISEELTADNFKEEIAKTYSKIAATLPEKEKLIISFAGIIDKIPGDVNVDILNAVSGGTPIFGGIPSDLYQMKNCHVFINGTAGMNKSAILLISGNIRPIFTAQQSISSFNNQNLEITKSMGSIVMELDGENFKSSIAKMGLEQQTDNVLAEFVSTPFCLNMKKENGDEYEVLRYLLAMTPEGIGVLAGSMPQGSVVRGGIVYREDVESSVNQAVLELLDRMKDVEDYNYSTLLCISCMGRRVLIADEENCEISPCKSAIPEGLTLSGSYSYAEYCPAKGKKLALEHNLFHNGTFAILAL